jgi:hypothetical protein
VDMFNFWVEISAIPLQLPREQDCWILLALVDQGFSEEELIRLNWVRCHQHVLFVLDVFDTNGRALDWWYLTRRPTAEVWSTLLFPRKLPPHWDFHVAEGTPPPCALGTRQALTGQSRCKGS